MNNELTMTEEMITPLLAGETQAGSAEKQPLRDSQLGYRRNVVAAVPESRDYCIRRDVPEISPMP
jgi:hypothetical protein